MTQKITNANLNTRLNDGSFLISSFRKGADSTAKAAVKKQEREIKMTKYIVVSYDRYTRNVEIKGIFEDEDMAEDFADSLADEDIQKHETNRHTFEIKEVEVEEDNEEDEEEEPYSDYAGLPYLNGNFYWGLREI